MHAHAQNGAAQSDRHMLEAQIAAVKASVKNLLDHLEQSERSPRATAFVHKVTEVIKAHPIKAVAVALGLGYAVMRIARR